MAIEDGDWVWLDTHQTISVTELSRVCGMSPPELDELIEYGALAPPETGPDEPRFKADCIATLRQAARLRRDFDLDLFAVSMLMAYLHRIEALEGRVRQLQAQLPAGFDAPPPEPQARARH